jgi:hypothetical protein
MSCIKMLAKYAVVGMLVLSVDSVHAQVPFGPQCKENHNHGALPWSIGDCPWKEMVDWCNRDTGFNEAAELLGPFLDSAVGIPTAD